MTTQNMKWYYESNGNPQGPILESELRQLKEDGKIESGCLVWREGMEDWVPLEQVREFGPAPKMKAFAEASLPSLQKESPSVSAVEAAPSPEEPPAGSASGSTEAVSEEPLQGGLPVPETAESVQSGSAPKWEHPGAGGPLVELVPSVVEILFSPAQTFRSLKQTGGWGMPLAFLAILNAVGTALVLWTVEKLPSTGSAFSQILRMMHTSELSVAMLVASILGSTLALPLTAVFKSGILHAFMRFGARSKAPFSVTFRTLCYVMGATSALWFVPLGAVWLSVFSGQPLVIESAMLLATGATGVWSMFVLIQALACSHGVSFWRAAVAVLVPPFVASVLLGVALAYAGARN